MATAESAGEDGSEPAGVSATSEPVAESSKWLLDVLKPAEKADVW